MRSDVRVLEVEPHFSAERARAPLKFGAVVVEGGTLCHVRVRVETRDGLVADGWGAGWLMDFWGWPSRLVPHEQREPAMRRVATDYCALLASYREPAHPIDVYLDLEPDLRASARRASAGLAEEMPFLAALVCAAPADAALHDAFGLANGLSSYDAVGPEHMRADLGEYLGPAFRGRYPRDYLRPAFRPQVPVFHLVGGLDKLRRAEVDASDPDDGLPNSLDEWVVRDGLRCLKVKLRGSDLPWDLARTREVAAVAREARARLDPADTAVQLSLDSNEQCASPDYMVELLRRLGEADPATFDAVLYVEQPTERDLRAHRFDQRELARLKPVVVDESLTGLDDLDLALELGWSGIALKTCKCHSSALLCHARAAGLGVPYTVQDLTNPGLALTHSLGLAARLDALNGIEANAHQFFPATSEPEARVHAGVFRRRDGCLSTASLGTLGLGHRVAEIDRPLFRAARR